MLTLNVNQRTAEVDVDPATPLIYVLRNDLALNGPKLGCARAQCGACTVLLDGSAVQSCQLSVGEAANRAITTLEGLGTPERPHPVQAAFLAEQAAQCGYCTSGMIMQAASLLAERRGSLTEAVGKAYMGLLDGGGGVVMGRLQRLSALWRDLTSKCALPVLVDHCLKST